MANTLWKDAISIPGLEAGWHLTRNELRRGFVVDYLGSDAFGNSLRPNLLELRRKLLSDAYHARPLISVSLPKGSLGTRPGSHISIEDRVVLWSILKVIAPIVSEKISNDVYSCRIKPDAGEGELFEETRIGEVLHVAYLKGQIIRQHIDPLEQWYEAWPEFEAESSKILEQGYDFLSVSDISAYFENISLPILRHQLFDFVPGEQKIVNHILNCLESWAVSTHEGFRPHRGIPQGSGVSSFLGNLYLSGIDDIFVQFRKDNDIKYIRYMDDIRIFSNNVSVARNVIFTLEDAVRKYHLNLQSAKTTILKEGQKNEIKNHIYDGRMDQLEALSNKLEKAESQRAVRHVIDECYELARSTPANPTCQKIMPLPGKLDSLTSRVSRRLMSVLVRAGDDRCGNYLFDCIRKNADFRFMTHFINYVKVNPKKNSFQSRIIEFLDSDESFFPHQEAELIGALRYFARLKPETKQYLRKRIDSMDRDYFYIQVQLCRVGPRVSLSEKAINRLRSNIPSTINDEAFCYKSFLLSASGNAKYDEIISIYERAPNTKLSMYGRHLRQIFTDHAYSKRMIEYISDVEQPSLINDYLGLLPYFMFSPDAKIVETTLTRLQPAGGAHPCIEIREHVNELMDRGELHLQNLV
ncbi:MAG: RNA-directed DNA polymerase [Pseudorhizobium pelagicum]|uniref:RNA-directed DNA polymerase n=1 Tax=Pseudorhizobium pelagicum TaxID=1509405 RepID=UPI0034608C48